MKPHLRKPARLPCSVSFRLSAADYARLSYDAAAANLRVNELARQRTLADNPAPTLTSHRRTDPALIVQLIAIGNNLNQLVKRFHITGRAPPNLENLCRRIEHLIDAAMQEGDN